MLKLTASILSITFLVMMMMMFWEDYDGIINSNNTNDDGDLYYSTATPLQRQLATILDEDVGCTSRQNRLIYVHIPKTG